MADPLSASKSINMRLSGRFLFLHTQKHTQEYPLDFKSSGIQHDCWLLAVHGPAAVWTFLLEASHTPPLVDFSLLKPTVPAPPYFDGFSVLSYACILLKRCCSGFAPGGIKTVGELVRQRSGKYPPFLFCLKKVGVCIFLSNQDFAGSQAAGGKRINNPRSGI